MSAEPYPPRMEYDDGALSCEGVAVGRLHHVEDFPCLDEDTDLDAMHGEIDATGRELARRYNAFPRLLAAAREVVAEMEAMVNVAQIMDLPVPRLRGIKELAEAIRACEEDVPDA